MPSVIELALNALNKNTQLNTIATLDPIIGRRMRGSKYVIAICFVTMQYEPRNMLAKNSGKKHIERTLS